MLMENERGPGISLHLFPHARIAAGPLFLLPSLYKDSPSIPESAPK
jgi:hypothetical protein